MLAITSHGEGPEARVDSRFGRCEYITFYDQDKKEYFARENPFLSQAGGAGISTAQYLSENDVEVLITGNVGPKAMQTLQAAGIKVYTGVSGTVKEAVEAFEAGKLEKTKKANVDSHFGRRGRGRR